MQLSTLVTIQESGLLLLYRAGVNAKGVMNTLEAGRQDPIVALPARKWIMPVVDFDHELQLKSIS